MLKRDFFRIFVYHDVEIGRRREKELITKLPSKVHSVTETNENYKIIALHQTLQKTMNEGHQHKNTFTLLIEDSNNGH